MSYLQKGFAILACAGMHLYSESKEGVHMKLILKILAAPIVTVLAILVWLCAFLLRFSSFAFGLAALLLGILSVALFVTGDIKNGCIMLAITFLVVPYGLPMLAVRLLGLIQRLRYAIQARVYG